MSSSANRDFMDSKNQVRLCGSSSSPCGYCNGSRAHLVNQEVDESSQIYGLLFAALAGSDYELLIQRGWRRSGLHLYKPLNDISCCPAYTIRLPVSEFKPSKSQRKIPKRMQSALQCSARKAARTRKSATKERRRVEESGILERLGQWAETALKRLVQDSPPNLPQAKFKVQAQKDTEVTVATTICAALEGVSKGRHDRNQLSQKLGEALKDEVSKSASFKGILIQSVQSHTPSGQVLVRLAVPNGVNGAHSSESMEISSVKCSIEEWCNGKIEPPYELTITTLGAMESALKPEVHKLYFEYQQKVHNDPDPVLEEEKEDWGDASESFREEAEKMLRAEYSPSLDEDEMKSMVSSYTSFFRFLVETSFPNDSGGQGTYHQHYRVNGILIAVGVLDLLPQGLSSVYAFYDASFSHNVCPLGKYMILKEIEYCRSLQLPYYYLGYYIHSCGKMRYKADYQPSELLCPETNRWVPAEQAKSTISSRSPERHYCRLFDQSGTATIEGEAQRLRHQIPLDVGAATLVTLNLLRSHGQEIVQPLVDEFISQVGSRVARNCIIKLV